MIQIVALTEESSSQDLLFFPRILHVSINMYFKTLGNSHLPTLQVILSILQGTFITTICRLILSLAAPRLCRQPFRSFASTSTQAHNHYASMEESLSPVSCSSVQDRPHPLLRSPLPPICAPPLSVIAASLCTQKLRGACLMADQHRPLLLLCSGSGGNAHMSSSDGA